MTEPQPVARTAEDKQLLRHRVRASLFQPLGHAAGVPAVHITSPLTRGGNYLYYWLWAHTNSLAGEKSRVQHHDVIDEWLREFPLLDALTVRKSIFLNVFAQWVSGHKHEFDMDFDREALTGFCREVVASSARFQHRLSVLRQQIDDGTCVLNVRRGDYYANPDLTPIYGIDIRKHVRESFEILESEGRTVSKVLFVSDDVAWCVENLAELVPAEHGVIDDRRSMFDDLAALATAPQLILANSTFSFWGAFIGDALAPERVVIAPSRHLIADDGTPYSATFDPRWRRTTAE